MNHNLAIALYAETVRLSALKAVLTPAEKELTDKLSGLFNGVGDKLVSELMKRTALTTGAGMDIGALITQTAFAMSKTVYEVIIDQIAPPPTSAMLLKDQVFTASKRTLNRMRDGIMGTLAEAQSDGVGIQEAARRMRDKFDDMTDFELERIARTEINGSQNLVNYQDMQRLRVPMIQWSSADDSRVRDSHRQLDGQIIRLGSKFSNGLKHPGDRSGPIEEWINCRCAAIAFIPPRGKIAPPGKESFYESDLISVNLSVVTPINITIKGEDMPNEITGPIAIKAGSKRIVVGPVLVPGEPDHEGEVLTTEKIEEVAYGFLEHFRYIDESHTLKGVGTPVSSEILRKDESFNLPDGSVLSLPAGTWILGTRVNDDETWKKVQEGTFKGFSIMGVSRKAYEAALSSQKSAGVTPFGMIRDNGSLRKILFSDLGEDWIGVAVSILEKPSVFKSKFIAIKSTDEDSDERLWQRILRRLNIYGEDKSAIKTNQKREVENMEDKEIKELIEQTIKGMAPEIVKAVVAELKPKEDTKPETEEAAKADEDETTEPEKKPEAAKAETEKAEAAKQDGEAAAVKGEVAELKKKLAEQEKVIGKLGDFMTSATKTRTLPAASEAGKAGGPPAVSRDMFGRVVRK